MAGCKNYLMGIASQIQSFIAANKERGLTQAQFARDCGMTAQALSYIIKHDPPYSSYEGAIAKRIGITVEQLKSGSTVAVSASAMQFAFRPPTLGEMYMTLSPERRARLEAIAHDLFTAQQIEDAPKTDAPTPANPYTKVAKIEKQKAGKKQ